METARAVGVRRPGWSVEVTKPAGQWSNGRITLHALRRLLARYLSTSVRTRHRLAVAYLAGDGIEIGALHNPLPLPKQARVRYVDRLSRDMLCRQYPELAQKSIVEPDIIDNGESLATIADESMDFIIANHFIEHCEDPIATMIAFFAKLRPHGVVYLAVPDKRFTFDQQRESTSIAHLQQDFSDGGVGSRTAHYLDFARYALLNGAATEREVAEWARQMIQVRYSIHFHVWTGDEFHEFLHWLGHEHLRHLEVVEARCNRGEGIFILRKVEPTRGGRYVPASVG